MNIIDFYKSLFESLGLAISEDGIIQVSNADGSKFESVKVPGTKKILRLPTTEFLKAPDYAVYTPFHPMYENILNNDAPTLTFIRNLIIAAVNRRYLATITAIAEFVSSVKASDKVTSTQLDICKALPNLDDKALKAITDVLSKVSHKLTSMVSTIVFPVIRPTNKNIPAEQNYNKVIDTNFPLYKLIGKIKDDTLLGVKLRKKDVQTLTDLYTKVLFNKNLVEYVYYSGSLAASNLHALLTWYVAITKIYNELNEKMGFDVVPLDFVEGLNDFEALKIQVPLLPDNEGEPKMRVNKQPAGLTSGNLKDISEIPTAAPTQSAPAVAPTVQVQQPTPQPVQQPVQQPVVQAPQPVAQAPAPAQVTRTPGGYQEQEGVDFVYEQIGNRRCKKYLNTAAFQASQGISPLVKTPYGMMPQQQMMAPQMYPQMPVNQYGNPAMMQQPMQPMQPMPMMPQQPMMPNPYLMQQQQMMQQQQYPQQYPQQYQQPMGIPMQQMPRIDPRTNMGRNANPAAYGMPTYNNMPVMQQQRRGTPYRG